MAKIILDICLSQIPEEKVKQATNGQKYAKLVLAEMKQPDKWGNEYTVYCLQTGMEQRQYVGKGKVYKAKPALEQPPFTEDMPF